MNSITVTLSEERLAQLREIAARYNVPLEDLARIGVEELLKRPDDALQHAIDHVLKKNTELYRRLS